MKRLACEKKFKKIKKYKCLFIFLVIFLGSLLALQIYFANQLVETGIIIREKSQKIERLKSQNQQLSENIARAASLETISIKAGKMGLIKLTSVIPLNATRGVYTGILKITFYKQKTI